MPVNPDSRSVIIKAEGVTKRFGSMVAVDRVDYQLYENEVAGILGKTEGAVKSLQHRALALLQKRIVRT